MRPCGSQAELEKRRRRAIGLLADGYSVTEVARRVGSSHSSVILWRDTHRRLGAGGLTAKPVPGRPPRLRPAQVKRLPRMLVRGALAWGYATDLWTTNRIAEVVQRAFGVRFHRAQVGRLLHRLGWSCQKPERRALERDEAAIAHWRRNRWVAIKKKPDA
jgi:transposase